VSTYRLYFTSTLSTSVEVEAEDLESAIEAAYDSNQMPTSICAQCTGYGSSWSMDHTGEWEFDETYYLIDDKETKGTK